LKEHILTFKYDHLTRYRPASRSETEKFILEDLFSSTLSQFKKFHPFGNLKSNNSGIFQRLKLRILVGEIPPICLELNFTPNTLGCYGLIDREAISKFRFLTKSTSLEVSYRFYIAR